MCLMLFLITQFSEYFWFYFIFLLALEPSEKYKFEVKLYKGENVL